MWVLGAQCGLLPDQVLDMSLPMLKAYIEGYQEHLFDMQCLAVHQGYWAGYYQSSKPKSASTILERMIKEHNEERKRKDRRYRNLPKPEVNVDRFLELEEKRKAFLERKNTRK